MTGTSWLQANHPALHMAAELDRDWIWLVAFLRGEDKKAVREAIKEFGFIFNRHGGHTLARFHTVWRERSVIED